MGSPRKATRWAPLLYKVGGVMYIRHSYGGYSTNPNDESRGFLKIYIHTPLYTIFFLKHTCKFIRQSVHVGP